MALTWPVVLAVLFGAFLHASWNALVKSSTDKALDTALINLLASFLAIPMVWWFGWPPPQAWPFIAASIVIHIGYYIALSGAYRHGELGLTYPLMRGSAPLLVALSASATLGETLSPLAWLGVVAVCAGVLTLGLTKHAFDAPRAVQFALVNAIIIAAYTVVDALGVRATGSAMQYVSALFLIDGWPFALIVFTRRGWKVGPYLRRRWPIGLAGAVAAIGSYGVALWAMTQAPVATVAALRETSVLFAVLLGVWFLKEVFTLRRTLGTCVIVSGVMALRLG